MSNKKSIAQENKIAKDLAGGKRQIGSGCIPFFKNDCISDNFLVEAKFTEPYTKGYVIKKAYWQDIEKNAFKLGRLPMMVIEFTGRPEVKLAVIRYTDALELDKYLSEEDNGRGTF